jgi:predicted ATPase
VSNDNGARLQGAASAEPHRCEYTDPRLVTRVRLRNYKSIAACDVEPGPLCFLVGPNGCGKSNFLDALRFVAEALRFSLEHALRDRGGIQEVRRRSGGHPNHFGIRLDLQLPARSAGMGFRSRRNPVVATASSRKSAPSWARAAKAPTK